MGDMPTWDIIQTHFPGPSNWYARVTWVDGSTWWGEPWNSEWAAERAAILARRSWALARRNEVGNGDTCPLYPEHGNMAVLTAGKGRAPVQWCPNAMHDGAGFASPGVRNVSSRAFWPVYGFEETVAAYMARFGLPDLSDLEVQS